MSNFSSSYKGRKTSTNARALINKTGNEYLTEKRQKGMKSFLCVENQL